VHVDAPTFVPIDRAAADIFQRFLACQVIGHFWAIVIAMLVFCVKAYLCVIITRQGKGGGHPGDATSYDYVFRHGSSFLLL
jgi:hypothetical protein